MPSTRSARGAVVVTGGHREQAIDVVFDGERVVELAGPRYPDGAAHGSGCTHSSTLAARLALGDDLEAAAREAKRVASEAVRDGLRAIGAGAGPVDVLGLARPALSAHGRPHGGRRHRRSHAGRTGGWPGTRALS